VAEFHLNIPLKDEEIKKLEIGDLVYFSGEAFTCRSMLQRVVFDEGWKLPFSTKERNVLIHMGPVIMKEGDKWKWRSGGPTSSIRFEKWGGKSVKEWGLKAIIGKTTMGIETQLAMKENVCIHASSPSIALNLWARQVKEVKGVYWLEELGLIEAPWILELDGWGPFIVDIDCEGRNYFDELDVVIENQRKKVYQDLKIPEDFEYTKLY
jgi:tartrate/fumarate subfamily iron-sulfur-dependent hydro-lyase beta chain